MRIELLEADLDDLDAQGIAPQEAVARGLRSLGRRPTHDRPRETPRSEAAVDELVHIYAEAAADLRLVRFAFATKAGDYHRSRERYDAVEETMADLQRDLAPQLRARLRALREREHELEHELRQRGVDPGPIGPHVPPERAIDPSPKPGEVGELRPSLEPLPPRRRLLERLLGSLTSRLER